MMKKDESSVLVDASIQINSPFPSSYSPFLKEHCNFILDKIKSARARYEYESGSPSFS